MILLSEITNRRYWLTSLLIFCLLFIAQKGISLLISRPVSSLSLAQLVSERDDFLSDSAFANRVLQLKHFYELNPNGPDEIYYFYGMLFAQDSDGSISSDLETFLTEQPQERQHQQQLAAKIKREAKNHPDTLTLFRLAVYHYWQENTSAFAWCCQKLGDSQIKYLNLMQGHELRARVRMGISVDDETRTRISIIRYYQSEIENRGAFCQAYEGLMEMNAIVEGELKPGELDSPPYDLESRDLLDEQLLTLRAVDYLYTEPNYIELLIKNSAYLLQLKAATLRVFDGLLAWNLISTGLLIALLIWYLSRLQSVASRQSITLPIVLFVGFVLAFVAEYVDMYLTENYLLETNNYHDATFIHCGFVSAIVRKSCILLPALFLYAKKRISAPIDYLITGSVSALGVHCLHLIVQADRLMLTFPDVSSELSSLLIPMCLSSLALYGFSQSGIKTDSNQTATILIYLLNSLLFDLFLWIAQDYLDYSGNYELLVWFGRACLVSWVWMLWQTGLRSHPIGVQVSPDRYWLRNRLIVGLGVISVLDRLTYAYGNTSYEDMTDLFSFGYEFIIILLVGSVLALLHPITSELREEENDKIEATLN